MEILDGKYLDDLEIKYKLAKGSTAVIYRTSDNEVLKEYYADMDTSKRLIDGITFLEYLLKLENYKNEFLVVPNKVYVNDNNNVLAYIYPYQDGTCIRKMYPKTNMDKLIDALERFYDSIHDYDYLILRDAHPRNIIYNGDIRLIDLDLYTLNPEKNNYNLNLSILNESIFRGIFGISILGKIEFHDKFVNDLYNLLSLRSMDVIDVLKSYKEYIKCKYGEPIYLRDYRCGLVSEKKYEYNKCRKRV